MSKLSAWDRQRLYIASQGRRCGAIADAVFSSVNSYVPPVGNSARNSSAVIFSYSSRYKAEPDAHGPVERRQATMSGLII